MCFEPLGDQRNEAMKPIIAAITNELMYQDRKWGRGKSQSLAGYLLILRNEIDEAIEGWMKDKDGRDAPLAEVVQVAAVAIRCLEEYGTKGSARPTRDVTEAQMSMERIEASARRFGSR